MKSKLRRKLHNMKCFFEKVRKYGVSYALAYKLWCVFDDMCNTAIGRKLMYVFDLYGKWDSIEEFLNKYDHHLDYDAV